MRNFKMLIRYDGSRYKGWQRLKDNDLTVQGKLQEVLNKFAGTYVEIIGSGRTDAGVHAKGQIANFHLDTTASPEELITYFNRYLPDDIAVIELKECAPGFHARFNAISKTYRYTIRTSNIPNVFKRKYEYTYTDYPLDVEKMKKAAAYLTGTHDFMSFCGNSHMKKSTERTIFSININEKESVINIDYTGNGFLQNMVRIMTGTLIEVGAGKRDPESIPSLLEGKKRSLAGFMAPPQGLCLMNVDYSSKG